MSPRTTVVALLCLASSLSAADALQSDFTRLTAGFSGRVGVCALQSARQACINGTQHFALQSVMKLLVCLAAMDAVDHRGWKLNDPVTLRKQDLSLYVQPIADIVNAKGSFTTTIGDLIRRAIVDSDSAATDNLVSRLGGPQAVQAFLDSKHLSGVRFDRDERHLQTEIVGIAWKPEYVDAALLNRASKGVPKETRDAANARYQKDMRDTATPLGMAQLLEALAGNELLSPASSRYIVETMKQTATFPDRLKAGTNQAGTNHGWTIAHKTGTSGTWRGVTVAINDVALLQSPNGNTVSLVVFIGDTKATEKEAGALMANLATATISRYR
jgi:beta-lactamase class A